MVYIYVRVGSELWVSKGEARVKKFKKREYDWTKTACILGSEIPQVLASKCISGLDRGCGHI